MKTAADPATLWRYRRALARVRVVDDVMASFATDWCGRPYRRRDVLPLSSAVELPGAIWTIEDEVIVELLWSLDGPSRLVVHDVAVLDSLRREVRSRHVVVEHISAAWSRLG